jgi:hypothetical protein
MSDQFSRPCTEEDRQLLSSLGLTFCLEEKDRKGSSWSAEEDHKLCEAFKANIAIEAIALNHKRSVGGIRSRLKKNQLIEYEDGKWQVVKVASSQSVKISKPNQNDYANCTSLNIPQKNEPIAPETSCQNLSPDQLDPQSLHAFGLISTRLKNCLESMNIEKIQDSFNLTPGKLIRTKNFGRQSIKELRNFQSKYFSDMNPLENKKKKISSNDIMNSLDYHIEDINDYINQVDKNISNNLYENDLKKVQNIFDKIKYYKNILKDLDYKALEIRYDVNLDKKNSEDWHDNGTNAQKILELIVNIIHFSVKNVRDAHIINLRIGLSEFGVPLTLEQVGNIYNVTRERIRQIEKNQWELFVKIYIFLQQVILMN